MSDASDAARRAQRSRAGRAALQGLVLIAALYAPAAGFVALPSGFDGGFRLADLQGLAWGLLLLAPLAVLFAALSEGGLRQRALRGGQFLVVVVALWFVFLALDQMNGF